TMSFLYFFFFQAEDGIRYRNVTGVQTCALPIFHRRQPQPLRLFLQDGYGYILEKESEGLWLSPVENTTVPSARGGSSLRNRRWRSEERRVGTECGSRWSLC